MANRYKMPALAITDHGNMFGAIDFYLTARKAGIKPILGAEVYVAPNSRFDKSARGIQEKNSHLILLVKDEQGYKNLMKLVSVGFLEGFYYKPRIDKEVLSNYSEGLIGLTACLKGEVSQLLQQNRFNDALKAADDYYQIFGKDNFYLELQENRIPEQKVVNEGLLKISKELSLPIVATNDVHYINKTDAYAHEALLCIQTQTILDNPNRMRLQTDEFYFKSPEEMKQLFDYAPEAILNTIRIAEKCNLELDFNEVHLPRYEPPGKETKEKYLRELCFEGLTKRFNEITPQIKERLEHELSIIEKMGFTSYFLIVWDFIHYAKQKNIPVGPGRGSAAGSLVSYLLEITDINPLKYGLLFERFLNPERLALPDIDIDFCYERRPEVIDYVTKKYGKDNVAQIITFGTMHARAVIRDVGRVMNAPYVEVDRIAKMIPTDPNITLSEALRTEPELNSQYKNDSKIKNIIDTARILEGLHRHASVHAAGVVIADAPLTNYLPLFKTGDDQITTGYSMHALEKIGLLKMDFLGLRTLTVINETIKIVEETRGANVDIEEIPIDDKKTFQLLSSAQTFGVFQLESTGMRDLLKKLEPSRFEDLIALLALYRPGPIGSGMLDDFIKRKKGVHSFSYDHPKLESILKDTYGIIVFQEQVMQIASDLAGFSLTQADHLRRAMSKKIPEVMERIRKEFTLGCFNNGIAKSLANKIFDLMEYFSGYGFNRSHSAAYALISYRTAYLKTNFPIEFMCALLTSEKDNTDKIVEYVKESERMGIEILPPDVQESFDQFRVVDKNKIRFGLSAVKNIGSGAIESIVKARKDGRFKSLHDFCERVDLRLVNRKVTESLIKCGAFDFFALYRSQLMAMIDQAIGLGGKLQKERGSGQISFFDMEDKGFEKTFDKPPQIKEWPENQILSFEKDMLGFYITGHPLARYETQLKKFASCSTADLIKAQDNENITIAGLITKLKHTVTRRTGERMAIFILEDFKGFVEVLVFPKSFQSISKSLKPNMIVLVKGRVNLREQAPKIIANDVKLIDEVYKSIQSINIELSGIHEDILRILREKLADYPGTTPVYLNLNTSSSKNVQIIVGEELYVQPNETLLYELESLLGDRKFSLTL